MSEVAQSAELYCTTEELAVAEVFHSVLACSSRSFCLHDDLVVLEVSLLQYNCSAVRELQLLVSESLILLLADNLSCCWQSSLVNQRLVLYVIYVCLNLLGTSLLEGLLQLCWLQVCLAVLLLLETSYYEVFVVLADELISNHIDDIYRDVWRNSCSHYLVLVLNREDRLAVGEVCRVFTTENVVVDLVATSVFLL